MKRFLKHLYCSLFHHASFKMMDNGCCVSCSKCKYSEAVLFLLLAIPFLSLSITSWVRAEEWNVPIMRVDMHLEAADDPSGPWISKTNTYTFFVADESQKFYRMRLEGTRFIR